MLSFRYFLLLSHISQKKKKGNRNTYQDRRQMPWVKVKVKSPNRVRLCNPMDCSLPSSSIHGILQARNLEWVAISFSRRSSQPRDWTQVSCIVGRRFPVWATRGRRRTCKTEDSAYFTQCSREINHSSNSWTTNPSNRAEFGFLCLFG